MDFFNHLKKRATRRFLASQLDPVLATFTDQQKQMFLAVLVDWLPKATADQLIERYGDREFTAETVLDVVDDYKLDEKLMNLVGKPQSANSSAISSAVIFNEKDLFACPECGYIHGINELRKLEFYEDQELTNSELINQ